MEILSYVMILGGIIFVIVYASTHPGEMPVHFDMDGNPDEYGSPWTFVFFPISMLVFNGILFVCLHFVNPKNWNVGVTVTATNTWICSGKLFCPKIADANIDELGCPFVCYYYLVLLQTLKGQEKIEHMECETNGF